MEKQTNLQSIIRSVVDLKSAGVETEFRVKETQFFGSSESGVVPKMEWFDSEDSQRAFGTFLNVIAWYHNPAEYVHILTLSNSAARISISMGPYLGAPTAWTPPFSTQETRGEVIVTVDEDGKISCTLELLEHTFKIVERTERLQKFKPFSNSQRFGHPNGHMIPTVFSSNNHPHVYGNPPMMAQNRWDQAQPTVPGKITDEEGRDVNDVEYLKSVVTPAIMEYPYLASCFRKHYSAAIASHVGSSDFIPRSTADLVIREVESDLLWNNVVNEPYNHNENFVRAFFNYALTDGDGTMVYVGYQEIKSETIIKNFTLFWQAYTEHRKASMNFCEAANRAYEDLVKFLADKKN
mgnify:CR=1 FL=1